MRAAGLTVICTLLQIVASQRTPAIYYISQDQVRDIGETVELECFTEYTEYYPILWMKTNKDHLISRLYSMNTYMIVKDSRFSIKTPDNNTFVLQIKDFQETDAGIYQCKIPMRNKDENAFVELLVRKPPIIYENSTESQVVSEKQSI